MQENMRSSRRNIIRMGAVVAAAVVAKTKSAAADRSRWDDVTGTIIITTTKRIAIIGGIIVS